MGLTVALARGTRGDTLSRRLSVVDRLAERAAAGKASVLVFPEWFLGIEPVSSADKVIDKLKGASERNSVAIVGGNILSGSARSGLSEQIVVVSPAGQVLAQSSKANPYQMEERKYRGGGELLTAELPAGTTAVLNGLDAVDSEIVAAAVNASPALIVIQLNPSSALEAEALRELALRMSETCGAVVCVPVLGADAGSLGIAGFIAASGEIVAEDDPFRQDDLEDLQIAEIDAETTRQVSRLGSSVRIPELLRQRYLSEVAGGSYFSDLDDRA